MGKPVARGLSEDGDVRGVIGAFKQILEALPNDHASLEALSNAYEHLGDFNKAKEYIVRLATVIINEHDAAAACALVEPFRKYTVDDPQVQMLLARLQESRD
jgi:tetratricopeptide (TPR) repeat protein